MKDAFYDHPVQPGIEFTAYRAEPTRGGETAHPAHAQAGCMGTHHIGDDSVNSARLAPLAKGFQQYRAQYLGSVDGRYLHRALIFRARLEPPVRRVSRPRPAAIPFNVAKAPRAELLAFASWLTLSRDRWLKVINRRFADYKVRHSGHFGIFSRLRMRFATHFDRQANSSRYRHRPG